ncbi:tRNA (adenine(37)-N6)-methyltransferase isoform X2 [Culex quinquefasciatus]|uniref:tRNA (adenine(37)-N6)-methyltransferase isoform X2 n=1 Tax=Culex quinquefasciatus TaxID=7176 RepID=UPI0018E31A53|nr:tRNA (adenine(37)-N6)-methyltransferase isoform X2 [Culex quinquefasciatus]
MSQSDIEFLKSQLSSARNEIKNLRQQISNLQRVHQKDVQNIRFSLENFQCKSCRSSSDAESPVYATERTENDQQTSGISFDPIGTIKTVFSDKRAVPRQASVASELLSRIELNPMIINNPEHSLEGLDSFSHIWILYHFHRNAAHFKTKVAPPRLGGIRIGVFSTRSPHRPCPIGLSLVQLDRIENSTIYFYGTDMVDGTPVLDIKPYIPQYDIPAKIDQQQFFSSREAPDGEEELAEAGPSTSSKTPSNVMVPNWIANGSTLNVLFNENASNQIQQLGIEQRSIVDILKADPRSVYLRTKYGSQIYTFQLGENTVTCKFDDQQSTVNVLQIRKLVNLSDMTDEIEDEKLN